MQARAGNVCGGSAGRLWIDYVFGGAGFWRRRQSGPQAFPARRPVIVSVGGKKN